MVDDRSIRQLNLQHRNALALAEPSSSVGSRSFRVVIWYQFQTTGTEPPDKRRHAVGSFASIARKGPPRIATNHHFCKAESGSSREAKKNTAVSLSPGADGCSGNHIDYHRFQLCIREKSTRRVWPNIPRCCRLRAVFTAADQAKTLRIVEFNCWTSDLARLDGIRGHGFFRIF